ncbi:MAG: ABC transporter permease [Collinsella sp.]|nr:ABC transporter permease [Collinsella sp.]
MSNEKKIIKEMVQGNLKVHRKRNLLLILAITLTTILFTSVLEIGFGGMQSIQETQLKLSGMKADAELRFLDKEQFQKVQNSDLFESVGGRVPLALMEGETKRPIEIDYLDKAGMEAYYLSLEEGKMPEDEKEVLLSEQALEELGIKKEVGSLVPMSFTLRGQEHNFDMRLSGWYKGGPKVNFLIVSETFLEHNPEVSENTYDIDKEILGTYYASVCMKNTGNIEQNLKEYVESLGAQTENADGNNYVNVAVNPMLYSEDGSTGVGLSIIFFGALFILCGYLLIYNIFDIGVMQDIQEFGIMKTIGMTAKQIKRLMRRQMLFLSLIGIPIGLVIGYGLGALLLPAILKNWEYSEEELIIVQSVHPAIFILTVLFVLITVFLSMRRPSKKATKYSAIETAKYIEVKKKIAEKDIHSIKNIAKSNLQRNRKRTTLVFTSLILSVIFVNSLWINAQMRRDYLVASTDTLNPSVGYVKPSASLNEEAIQELEKNAMIKNGTKLYKNTIDDSVYNSNISYDWGVKVIDIKIPSIEIDGVITNSATTNYGSLTLGKDNRPICNVCGISENFLKKMEILEGEKNIDEIAEKLKSGDYILVGVCANNKGKPSTSDIENSPKVGDSVTIYKDGKPIKEVEVLSHILTIYSEQISGGSSTGSGTILGTWFYLGEDLFEELYGEGNLVNYSFDADEKDAPAVNRMLQEISKEFSDVGFETTEQRHSEIENYRMLVRILCVLIGGILGAIGIVNLVNIIFTNLIVRNRELATFRSIGATKKQLRELIIRESVGYVFYAAIGGFILATIISMTAVKGICSSIWLFTFQFTLLPAAIVIVLYLIIAIIASEAGIYLWEKGSITERLRNL